MKTKLITIGLLLALAPCASALAVDVFETNRTNPSGNCDGAMPVYDAMLRNRPLSLVNELGSTMAYTTCAYTTSDPSLGPSEFGTRLTNMSTTTVTLNCTVVFGQECLATWYPKSIILAPATSGFLIWTRAADNGGVVFDKRVSLSCALPPKVALNENWVTVLVSVL